MTIAILKNVTESNTNGNSVRLFLKYSFQVFVSIGPAVFPCNSQKVWQTSFPMIVEVIVTLTKEK